MLHVPLPAGWEHWRDAYLQHEVQKLLLFLVLATGLYLLARFARRQVGRQIEVVNRRSSRNH